MSRTVWILSAGFSRSLGGPLFETLFGPWLMAHLKAHFPSDEFANLYGRDADVAHWLYNYGRRFILGRSQLWDRNETGEELWQDAEQYLQILDDAASSPGSPWTTRIADILKTHVSGWTARADPRNLLELNGAARRLLAAECSAFTKALDLKYDPAIPYRDWARRLTNEDTIISFNYDCLLERLGATSDTIDCLVPDGGPRRPGAESMATAYKLHGSVDWLVADAVPFDPQQIQRSTDEFAAVNCERHERLVIGSPGQTKSKLTEVLREKLWEPAGVALAEASAIVFVGYRFPPTDTYAQKFLLDAIEGNRSDYLAIHVVLGPNIGSPDIVRVRQLLALAVASRQEMPVLHQTSPYPRSFNLLVRPLYAADFLGRAKPEQIGRFRVRSPEAQKAPGAGLALQCCRREMRSRRREGRFDRGQKIQLAPEVKPQRACGSIEPAMHGGPRLAMSFVNSSLRG
jgi:hypothetical protein